MEDLEEMCKRLTQIYEEVTECPVCLGTMDSTLKQCINGHGVCSLCASKINKCPLCQQGLVVHKNILLCRLLESFPKPCPNVARGCKKILSDKDHDKFCEFRISKCLKKSCEWEGSVKYLTGHVKTCTKVSDVLELASTNTETTRFYTINSPDSKFLVVTPIVFQNQLFWKYCYRDGLTKRFSYAFHHVATSKPTCSYVFIVSFKRGGVTYFTHCCKATTDFSGRMNKANESGFIIPTRELDRFRQPNSNKYFYCLKVIIED